MTWLLLLLVITAAGWYAYKEFTRTHKDLAKVKPDFVLTARALLAEFEANDSAAGKKFNDKIMEVSGLVKKLEKDEQGYYTIVLGDSSSLSAVRCSVDTTHNPDAAAVKENSSVTLRGVCTGFNKDEMGLGADVILNRSVLVNKE